MYVKIRIVLLSMSGKDFMIKFSILSNLLKLPNNINYWISFIIESGA